MVCRVVICVVAVCVCRGVWYVCGGCTVCGICAVRVLWCVQVLCCGVACVFCGIRVCGVVCCDACVALCVPVCGLTRGSWPAHFHPNLSKLCSRQEENVDGTV